MANVAQTVNCIHSLFLAVGDRYTRTPPYYVFEMYRPHMGARAVPMRIPDEPQTVAVQQGTASIPRLTGSASIREKRLTVTLTNPSVDAGVTARLRLGGGARVSEGRGRVLTHSDMRARNTFERPDEVALATLTVTVDRDSLLVEIPRHSVVALEIAIA
jgi:alpha-N-arabinofuranosidase